MPVRLEMKELKYRLILPRSENRILAGTCVSISIINGVKSLRFQSPSGMKFIIPIHGYMEMQELVSSETARQQRSPASTIKEIYTVTFSSIHRLDYQLWKEHSP